MKKLSLFLLVSVFAFCGCSDDDDAKTYVLSLPNYETHTLDLGDTKNPVDQWSTSYEYEGQTYITNYFQTLLTDNKIIRYSNLTASHPMLMDLEAIVLHSPIAQSTTVLISPFMIIVP